MKYRNAGPGNCYKNYYSQAVKRSASPHQKLNFLGVIKKKSCGISMAGESWVLGMEFPIVKWCCSTVL